jgi:hypothetical protein
MERGELGVVAVVNSQVVVVAGGGVLAASRGDEEQPARRPAMSPARPREARVARRRVMRNVVEIDMSGTPTELTEWRSLSGSDAF